MRGDVEGDNEASELVLQIQGIVHNMNLMLTGDWEWYM